METLDRLPLGIFVAALGGLAIGLEREWSGHTAGPEVRFGGIRTFTLLGGIAGALWTLQLEALAIVLLGLWPRAIQTSRRRGTGRHGPGHVATLIWHGYQAPS